MVSRFSSSATSSHFRMAQNTIAVQRFDIPKTLASTAENQKESEKVNAIDPTNAAAKMLHILVLVISPSFAMILRASMVMVQNRKRMVKLLERLSMALISRATLAVFPKANRAKMRPIIWNVGAPGGCPI